CEDCIWLDKLQAGMAQTVTDFRMERCAHDNGVHRRDFVLEGARPVVLRYRSRGAEPRFESDIRIRNVWLGSDSSTCSDRQYRVADLLVSEGRPLPCAHQSERSKS